MKFFGGLSGIFVLGIFFYIYSVKDQSRDVAQLCSEYPVGSQAANLFTDAERYSGDLMGAHEFSDKLKTQNFIYCAPLTMCDVSCSLEIEGGVVTKSAFSSL